MRQVTTSALIAVALSISTFAVPAMAEKTFLKTPIAFGSHLPALGTPIKWVSEQLAVMSDDKLRMKIYEPGKLVSAKEILDAVSTGKVNSGYATAGYWQGKMPAAALFSSVPFGPEAIEYMAWLYYGNGLKLYQKMYDTNGYNVKVLPCAIISPETSGWFKKEINTPEDLRGLNMRFFGLGASVMEKMGVSTTQLAAGEIFGALEKGAIDASEFSQPAIDQRLGFHKIMKYNYFPGWHQQATVFELLINKTTWAKIPESHKAIIKNTCMASMTNAIAEGESMQFDVMAKSQENGVEIRFWSDAMLKEFEEKWLEVVVEKNAQDSFFKEVWADLSAFRKGYDLWEANAFLPRVAAQ